MQYGQKMNSKLETRVERTLAQLSTTFTVCDIMVDLPHLVRAKDYEEARQFLSNCPRIDVIPIPAIGPVRGYLHRVGSRKERIRPIDLISDGTSIIDLPDLLSERDFFFVLSLNDICGFVHFSDLNKGLVKLPFFVLFEAVERHLWTAVTTKLTEGDLEKVLDKKRVKILKQRMNRAKKRNVDLGWAGLLSFDEILRFSVHYGVIKLPNSELKVLTNIRNKIVHSDRLLVDEHKDVQKLVQSRELCRKLLLHED
jgi:hypothetical protein